MTGRARRVPLPPALVAAVASTVVVAVGADLVAGRHTAHVAVLAAVALALGTVRVRAAGRHRPTFAVLSALLVLPPVLDAIAALGGGPATDGSLHHLDADTALSAGHVLIAFAAAALVGATETLVEALGRGARAWLVALLTARPAAPASSAASLAPWVDATPPLARLEGGRFARRRGPPAA